LFFFKKTKKRLKKQKKQVGCFFLKYAFSSTLLWKQGIFTLQLLLGASLKAK